MPASPVCDDAETSPRRVTGAAPLVRPDDPAVSHALLLRVWPEESGPRCRLIGVGPLPAGSEETTVVQGIDAILDAVRTWLTSD